MSASSLSDRPSESTAGWRLSRSSLKAKKDAGVYVATQAAALAARRAVAESGYDGTPVVVLDAQDSTISHTFALVSADMLRRVGMNVDVQAMDWATLIQRRLSRNPANQNGWGLFVSAPTGLDGMDPSGHNAMRSACERTALPGWPCDAEMERIRDAFIAATSDAQRAEAAQAYHRRATETVP